MRRIVILVSSSGNEADGSAREFGSPFSETDINSVQKKFRTTKVTPVYAK
ncbi:MAG TPA: hypothetical protein VK673_07105 [Chthoniobacterales bacterium]|nr:hypothetical protein [Chthoniobacterales bacterium]